VCLFDFTKKNQDHLIFKKRTNGGKEQAHAAQQLMVCLKFVGTEETGANNPGQRNAFGIDHGTFDLCRDRVIIALRSLREEHVHWPHAKERDEIACLE